MSGLLWLILCSIGAVMLLSTLRFIVRLRNFSRAQNQTYLDNRLWETMLGDDALTPELRKALLKHSTDQHNAVEGNTNLDNNENDDTEAIFFDSAENTALEENEEEITKQPPAKIGGFNSRLKVGIQVKDPL